MQLRSKMIQHFDSDQIFSNLGMECEGAFNEIYCPSASGSVFFWIPKDDEEMKELKPCEQEVAKILVEYGGATYGATVAIDFDY